jgi:preprotein translocase subunit SecD
MALRLEKEDRESFYELTSNNVGKMAEITSRGETLLSARIMEPIRDGGLQFSFSDAALLKRFLELIGENDSRKAGR